MTRSRGEDPVQLDRGWRVWRLAALRSAGLPFDLLAGLATELGPAPRSDDEPAERVADSTTGGIARLLGDNAFRTAMTWQNPDLVRNWLGAHARRAVGGTLPRRERVRREAVIARYAQRYCAKNDTIGFFGPVAWAVLGGEATGHTGTGSVRRGHVSFESWAVQSVAETWNDDPDLLPHLPVRLSPSCTVVGDQVRRPLRGPLTLTGPARVLLDALPDAESVGVLWERCGLTTAEADATLAMLRAQQVLQIGFLVPLDTTPERHLARQVAAVVDPAVRRRLSTVLDELSGAVGAVRVAEEPERLLDALTEAERRLAKVTGRPARHRPGLANGGRTPLYLDCRRDLDATIGPDLLEDLHAPLAILLDSARWLAGQVGEAVEDGLWKRYRMLRGRRDAVTLADMQLAAADLLSGADGSLAEISADFQLRWAEILPGGDGDALVPATRARRLADGLFPATGRWWAASRVHSPDLMLRRAADGRLSWVLGELHVALNTLENRFFGAQADDRDELVAAVARDAAPGRVVPVYPNTAVEVSARGYPPPSLDPPGRYRYWSFGHDAGHATGVRSTPATALLVNEDAGRLVATGNGWTAPVLECFGEFVSALAVNLFRLRAPRPFAPRVNIDRLTVCRRTWRFPVGAMGRVPVRSGDPAHERLRGWMAARGVPRHVFARGPRHPKPFYVDFGAPVLVDNLARALRGCGPDDEVEVVEMLPSPDELWLSLGTGRYTSELRVVAVDPVTPDPASWDTTGVSGMDETQARTEEAPQ